MKLKNPIVGIAAVSAAMASMQALSPGLASIQAEYNIDPNSTALLMTVPSLVMIPFALLGANLVRYMSKKTICLLGVLLISVMGFLPFLLNSYMSILVTRGIMGIGLGFLVCISPSLAADYYPIGAQRNKAMGIQGAFAGGSGIVYSYISGLLCEISTRAIFITSLIPLLLFIIVMITLPEQHKEPAAPATDSAVFKPKSSGIDPHVFTYVIQVLVFSICAGTLMINLSQVIVDDGIGTPVNAGTVLSLFSAGGLLIGFTFSQFMRICKKYATAVGVALTAIGLLGIGLTKSLVFYSIVAVIAGVGFNLFITACIANINNNISSDKRTMSMGIFMAFNSLAQFLSPFVITLLVTPFGGDARSKINIAGIILIVLAAALFLPSLFKKEAKA